jgi:hypothetical protein
MFNFLRKKGQESPLNHDTEPLVPENSVEEGMLKGEKSNHSLENATQSGLPDFRANLADLQAAMKIQKELGGSLAPEDVFRMTGMSPEDLHNFLSGQEMAIKTDGEQIMTEIESALSMMEGSGDKADRSWMQIFADNKAVRAAFITLMIFTKFAPQAHGAENKDQLKDNLETPKEIQKSFNNEPDPDKTYQASAADFESVSDGDAKPLKANVEESSRLVSLDMKNYFSTDKAEITNAQGIVSSFESFLANITTDNAKDIIASDFTLFGSSDERPTSEWEGKNEELTNARLRVIDQLLTKSLENYDFKNLPDDLAKQLKAKGFKHEMPNSDSGPEKGVTYITDLQNPDTDKQYTKTEVEKIKNSDPVKYKSLLDDCRKISFSVSVPKNISVDKMSSKNPVNLPENYDIKTQDMKLPIFENLEVYNGITFLFDNSPSVSDSYEDMADIIAKQDFKGLKINFATFSNNMDRIKQFKDPAAIAEEVRSMKYDGNWHEKGLDVACTAVDKLPDGELVFVLTDELLQDVSWSKIQKLRAQAGEKGDNVFFFYRDDKKRELRQISLNDLDAGFKKQVMADVAKEIAFSKKMAKRNIFVLETEKSVQEDLLVKLAKRGQNSKTQESIQSSSETLESLKEKIAAETGKLSALSDAWEKGDLLALFAQQENYNLQVGRGEEIQVFDREMVINVSSQDLGVKVLDLPPAVDVKEKR